MTRFDLYGKAHKGIRATLFETAALVARTDFGRDGEATAAAAAVRRLVWILERHAEHEDAVVMPEIRAIAPELFHDLATDHARTDGLQGEIERLAARAEGASGAERASVGRRLLDAVNGLVAEHLRHMAREEGEATRALWAHRNDEQLAALVARIVAMQTPAETSEWLAMVLPAVCHSERADLLAYVRAAVPPPIFDDLTARARHVVGPSVWAEAITAAGT